MSDDAVAPSPAVMARTLAEADFPPSDPVDYVKARAFEEILIGLVGLANMPGSGPLHGAVRNAGFSMLKIAAEALKAPENQPEQMSVRG